MKTITLKRVFSNLPFLRRFSDDWLVQNKLERINANRTDLFKPSQTDFHKNRYEFACSYVKNPTVLDVVFGLDVDHGAVDYANRTYAKPKLGFLEGTIVDMPFRDGLFDVVVSFETIEHVEDEAAQLREVFRVLKPSGLYILSTPNDWGTDEKAPFHVRSYTLESLRTSIEHFFRIESIYNQNSGTPGRTQNHDQPRGIVETADSNWQLAECYLVVARKHESSVTL